MAYAGSAAVLVLWDVLACTVGVLTSSVLVLVRMVGAVVCGVYVAVIVVKVVVDFVIDGMLYDSISELMLVTTGSPGGLGGFVIVTVVD